jgi:Flp pilus assembly protein TadD
MIWSNSHIYSLTTPHHLNRENMIFRFALLSLLWFACAAVQYPAHAETDSGDAASADIQYLLATDAAIKNGRYVQAQQMLSWLKDNAHKSLNDDVALLHAEYYSVEGRVADVTAALAEINDKGRNACRQDSIRGWIAGKQGDASRSILFLARATTICPDDVGAWNLLGLAFAEKGEVAASREAFEKALSLSPRQPGLLNNYALALLQSGETKTASQKLEQALAIDPANPAIIANRDFVNAMLGRKPVRTADETEAQWANRLLSAGNGARAGQNQALTTALFSQAVLLLDHFDERAWGIATQLSSTSIK